MLAELRRGDTEVEGSLQAAAAASVSLLQGDGDVATAHRFAGRLRSTAVRATLTPAILSLPRRSSSSCGCAGTAARRICGVVRGCDGPQRLDPAGHRSVQHDLRRSRRIRGRQRSRRSSRRSAGWETKPSPTQIVRIGFAATYVDRLEGCRPALWRVVRDARLGGAVASGIPARVMLARDDIATGDWDEAERLAGEASQVCEAHGYQAMIWPCRYLQAMVAAGRGGDERAMELTDDIVRWTAPRGIRIGEWFAWQPRGLAALGRGDFEEAYRLTSMISPPGLFAPYAPGALYVLMDLVDAAVRTGREAEAAAHVAAMQEANIAQISSRLALVVGASAAMVAPDDLARELFQETLALPGIERWQFDLARVRLAYGERLRRSRAMTDSRVQLNAALATFERLGARPWVRPHDRRAAGERADQAEGRRERPGPAHAPGVRDRHPRGVGPDEQTDRGTTVPVAPDCRRSPPPSLPQARRRDTSCSSRRARVPPRRSSSRTSDRRVAPCGRIGSSDRRAPGDSGPVSPPH